MTNFRVIKKREEGISIFFFTRIQGNLTKWDPDPDPSFRFIETETCD